MTPQQTTRLIKQLAGECGFVACGIAPAQPIAEHRTRRFEQWAHSDLAGPLDYLRRNESLRSNPSELVESAASVICLAVGYHWPVGDADPAAGLIARFAQGREYHKHLKKRCRRLLGMLEQRVGRAISGRVFVDSAPVMERSLAASASLGWIGRNGCLIVPGIGSFVLLAEIICDLPAQPDEHQGGSCGDCRLCSQACPTGALQGGGLLDVRICLSCRNQRPDPIDPALAGKMGRWLWGCDICQQCCPYNRDVPVGDAELRGPQPVGSIDLGDLLAWNPARWDTQTRGLGIRKAPLDVLQRNAVIAAGNSGLAELAGPLELLRPGRADLSELIDWALDRLVGCDED